MTMPLSTTGAASGSSVGGHAVDRQTVERQTVDGHTVTIPQPPAELFDPSAPAMTQLKLRTRPLHNDAEVVLRPAERLQQPGGYVDLLSVFWLSLVPVERVMQRHPCWPDIPDAARRMIADSLAEDFRRLGATPPAIETTAAIQSEAELLGCCYVVEGSSLGGVFLSQMVRDVWSDLPTRYFDRYGDQIGPIWKRLGAHINARLTTPSQIDEAIAAAERTFARVITVGETLSV